MLYQGFGIWSSKLWLSVSFSNLRGSNDEYDFRLADMAQFIGSTTLCKGDTHSKVGVKNAAQDSGTRDITQGIGASFDDMLHPPPDTPQAASLSNLSADKALLLQMASWQRWLPGITTRPPDSALASDSVTRPCTQTLPLLSSNRAF